MVRRMRGKAGWRDRNIVSFSAICAHKLAYPTRRCRSPARALGHIRRAGFTAVRITAFTIRRRERAWLQGRPTTLAAILLEYDSAADGLYALGTLGRSSSNPLRNTA
jgi:hypothetical protein